MQFAIEISGYIEGDSAEELEESLEKKLKEIGVLEADISLMEAPPEEDEEDEEEV